MKWVTPLVAGLAMFVFSAPMPAMDLNGAYALAKQRDPKLRKAYQDLLATSEAKPQAESLLLPRLSATGNTQYHRRDVNQSLTGAFEYDELNLTAGLSVTQPIYHRDYWLQLEQSDHVVVRAQAEYSAAELDLIVRLAKAYFAVLSAQDDLQVSIAERNANERSLEQSKQRFEVGLIAITDVHESQAAYDAARSREISSMNAVDGAKEALREIIGDYPADSLWLLGEQLGLKPPEPNDIEVWATRALEQNVSVQASTQAVEVAKRQVEINRSGHYPYFDAVGTFNLAGSNEDRYGNDFNDTVIGVQMVLPLYQGGAVDSKVRQALYSLDSSRENHDAVVRSVNRQVRDAFRGVLSSISQIGALQAARISARSALESTQAGYEVGTRTIVDVLTVQRSVYDAERNYASARYAYVVNGIQLHSAAGTLNEGLLDRANQWLVRPQ